jgi:hypothetical protein
MDVGVKVVVAVEVSVEVAVSVTVKVGVCVGGAVKVGMLKTMNVPVGAGWIVSRKPK